MTHQPSERRYKRRRALVAVLCTLGLLGIFGLQLGAQEKLKEPKVADKGTARRALDAALRESIEVSGYTRPGTPDDTIGADGKIIPAAAFGPGLQKFKIMGGTVYFAVFKNTGLENGDVFGTGMPNFDSRFQEGRSFSNSFSPRYDRAAKYLYLYQVVNDRGLDPSQRPAPAKQKDIKNPVFDPKVETGFPKAEDLGSFALKLLADPRYITSWGHFDGSAFAANVVDVNSKGEVIKQVVDEGGKKVEREREIRLALSFVPAIEMRISHRRFGQHARSYPLDELSAGFGVDKAAINLQDTRAAVELKEAAAQMEKQKIVWASTSVGSRLKATKLANEPDYVQLMYLSNEERIALATAAGAADMTGLVDDDITRAIFRVDWRQANVLKQGENSVVFGFTTDLPPTTAPIRIDTPQAAVVSEGLRLASYFADAPASRAGVVAPGTGAAPGVAPGVGEGIVPAVGGVDAAATALAVGTALGQGASPVPGGGGGGAGGAGFSGITGGVGSLGGGFGGMGGGGIGFPGFGSGLNHGTGTTGGGGGTTGGGGGTPTTGTGTTTGTGNNNQNANANVPVVQVNFNALLQNQQSQQQQQQQQQRQSQNQSNHNNHNHHHNHGHVVPAPASLLLGLLGLPGLLLFRRRKTSAE